MLNRCKDCEQLTANSPYCDECEYQREVEEDNRATRFTVEDSLGD